MNRFILLLLFSATIVVSFARPTSYTTDECYGSSRPYPTPQNLCTFPDSLTPVMINHVSRHGARFPSSSKACDLLLGALKQAEEAHTITTRGKEMKRIVEHIIDLSSGRWGILDSLGIAEQQGIAARMYATYPALFKSTQVNAISSYVPRCVLSMYEFTHQLARLHPDIEITTSSGSINSPLLRFFDLNQNYTSLVGSKKINAPYHAYRDTMITYAPLRRILGRSFPLSKIDSTAVAQAEYSVVASMAAMEMPCDVKRFFEPEEFNAMWAINNLRQYLTHSASGISTLPADIAAPLLQNIIETTDAFLQGDGVAPIQLRFGHAETLMPLLALMRLDGCRYITDDPGSVAANWHNFHVVPMASNLQLVIFRSKTGRHYVRAELNEQPIPIIPGSDDLFIPWNKAKIFFQECLGL